MLEKNDLKATKLQASSQKIHEIIEPDFQTLSLAKKKFKRELLMMEFPFLRWWAPKKIRSEKEKRNNLISRYSNKRRHRFDGISFSCSF